MEMQELLDGFLAFWAKKVKRGQVSGLSNIEVLVLEGFIIWLLSTHTVARKPKLDRYWAI